AANFPTIPSKSVRNEQFLSRLAGAGRPVSHPFLEIRDLSMYFSWSLINVFRDDCGCCPESLAVLGRRGELDSKSPYERELLALLALVLALWTIPMSDRGREGAVPQTRRAIPVLGRP